MILSSISWIIYLNLHIFFVNRKRHASDSIDDESHSSWTDVETRVGDQLMGLHFSLVQSHSKRRDTQQTLLFLFQCSTAIEGRPGTGPSYCHTAAK